MSFFIYGAGGHGKVVLDAMENSNQPCSGFIDSNNVNGWAGIRADGENSLPAADSCAIHIAIGHAESRAKLAQILSALRYSFFTVRHPSAMVSRHSKIGLGTFMAASSVIAPYAKVGSHVIVNHGAVIDHDCVVGDVAHIAPRAVLGGGAVIGDGAFIGSGAVVLPRITIGNNAIVGAGAVVTKNVAPGTTVVGNPAKLLVK